MATAATGTLAAGGLTIGAAALTGCEEQGPAERAGETIDEAAEDVGDALEEAGEDIRDGTRR
jgi:hypothetical protein